MAGRINGFSLAYTAIGGVVLWSGIKGWTVSETLRNVIAGKMPAANSEPITDDASLTAAAAAGTAGTTAAAAAGPGDTGAHSTTAAANQAIARVLAAPYGWSTGTEWSDLVSLWNRESGWSNTARNAQSGAYGIAQALGHGPTNQYPAGPANPPTSSASAQIAWGLQYIKQQYGDPIRAWAHEQAYSWY